ncbi:GH32 C-terminal domain-containing protein [Microbacterium sp. JZ101]
MTSRRARTRLAVLAAFSIVLAVVVALVWAWPRDDGRSAPGSSGSPAATAEGRPSIHLTPSAHWMNDPQRPVFVDGRWHLYYLYNADHPHGNGTAWYHVSSTDLVHWRDEGVAIEKYRNGLGDIWTGSVVVDKRGTAGFGAGALVALVTQQDDGVQRQSLFFSTDGGESFASYDGNPVMDNPGVDAWRDPKVIWDEQRGRWLMLLAEGDKIGFYTSPDLKEWTYRSGLERDDLGVLECPDLFEMTAEDGSRHWVLGVSANGEGHGRTTGYAYWTGSFDGEAFVPSEDDPLWLDGGADFYAGVTWSDPRDGAASMRRYALGWMNNWAYAGSLPTAGWQGGALSIVRELRLREQDRRLALTSEPIDAIGALEGAPVSASGIRIVEGETAVDGIPQPAEGAFRLRMTIAQDPRDPADEVRVRVGDESAFATVGADFAQGAVFLARDADLAADAMPEQYGAVRTARAPLADGRVEFDVVVDAISIEAFAEGGIASLTGLVFLDPAGRAIAVESVGGDVIVEDVSVAPLASAR